MTLERYREGRAVRLALALLAALLLAALGTGAASAQVWTIEVVDPAAVCDGMDMALDAAGNPHIIHINSFNGNPVHTWREAGGWQTEVVDPVYCAWTSIALDSAGNPCISYTDVGTPYSATYILKYARKDAGGWHVETLESYEYGRTGHYSSLALDAAGNPHISYYLNRDAGYLVHAWRETGWWRAEAMDMGEYERTSIALDAAGNPGISYFDRTNSDLKYAWRDASGWDVETVDAAGEIGEYSSLALDAAGNPCISYYDATNADLKYARRDGTGWHIGIVDAAGQVGIYSSLALDAAGSPCISYYDASNGDLRYAWRDGTGWHTQTVDEAGYAGIYPSLAVDSAGTPGISSCGSSGLTYAWAGTPPGPAIEVTVEVSGDFGNTWQDADDAPGPYLEQLPMVPQVRYTIANTGDVPLLSCAIAGVATFGPLNPGMSRTEQRTYAWAADQQFVEATATGTYNGQAVTDTDRAYYFGAAPAIAIEVRTNGADADAPPGPTIAAGSPVTWTYAVTNTGNVALSGITVTDDTGVAVTAPKTALQPGESMTATATGTALAGPYANNGTATGTPPGGLPDVTATDPSHYYGVAPRVANFTWAPAAPRAGEEVGFTDISTGGPEWWEWSFGDGATSTAQHPVHVFAAPGNYTVRLTAYYPGSEIGRDAARTVTVSAPPVGGSTAFYLVSTAPTGAKVFLRDIGGDLHLAGNTSAGPLNVTVYLTGTPVTAIVANLTGYADAVHNLTGYPDPGETIAVNLTLAPLLLPVPSSTAVPTDPDGDDVYDDVNGNGREDFADVVLFFNQMSWIAANEPVAAFDYNGNGRIDFADVVWLFNNL